MTGLVVHSHILKKKMKKDFEPMKPAIKKYTQIKINMPNINAFQY